MTLIVACPNCQTRYNLPDKFQGKKVKCKSCGKPFSTTVGATRATDARVNQETQRAQPVDAHELSKMGIGEIRSQPDPFATPAHRGPDPLRNHVVQDPGFGAVGIPGAAPGMGSHTEDEDDDPNSEFQSVVSNPYLTPTKPKRDAGSPQTGERKRKKKKRDELVWYMQPWFMLTVVFIPLFLISILFSTTGIVEAGVANNIAFGTFILFGIVNTVIGFWGLGLVRESGDNTQVLLCRFIPGYILVYMFTQWQTMKDYAFAVFAGILLTPLGFVMLVLGKFWFFAGEMEEM